MVMVVRQAMTDYFASAHISSTLGDAMDKMLAEGLGILFVVDDKSQVVGWIGERLLMHVIDNPEMRDDPATQYMDRGISVIQLDDDLVQASHLFRQLGVSELPVVDENKLVGVLTIRQMLRAIFSSSKCEKPAFQAV